MRKIFFYILLSFIVGICGGIFADQILWPYFVEKPLFYKYNLEQTPVYVTERKEITIQENVALQNAFDKVKNTIIGIKTIVPKSKVLEGSGLILTSDGLVVTLADLVPKGGDFNFFVDGELVSFQILKRDLKENLALIKIKQENLPTVEFAEFEKLRQGERVFLAGIIFEEGEIKKIVNEGVVKYFDKEIIKTSILETTTLAGSPLFNIEGKLLGLNLVDKWGRVSTIPIIKIKSFAGF